MSSVLKNWKTSLGGGLTILLGVSALLGIKVVGVGAVDPQVAMSMIIGGFTLLFAKDGNVTGT